MQEQRHYIDQLFKKAVEQHSELPSEKVWENLEKTLQKRNVTSIRIKYKKWKWVAAALFIFSAGLAMYTIHLTAKYKKAVEKKQQLPNADNARNRGTNTSIAKAITDKKPGGQLKTNNNSSKKTSDENTGLHYPPANQQLSNADSKSSGSSETTIIAKTEATKKKGILNDGKIDRTAATSPTASLMPLNGTVKHKNRRSFNNYSRQTDAKRLVEEQPANGSLVKSEIDDEKKQTGTPSLRSNRAEDLEESTHLMNASTIGKSIEFSSGTVIIPYSLLKNRPALPLIGENAQLTNAAANQTENKNKVSTVRASINRGKFEAAIYYSQHMIYNKLAPNNPDFREDNYIRIKNSEESAVANVAGFSIERNLGWSFGIESGLGFQTFITHIASKPLVARRDNNGKINYRISTSSGYAYYAVKNLPNPSLMDSIRTLSSKSTIRYISVPVGFVYHLFVGKRVNISPAALLSANFLSSGKISTIQSSERTFSGELEGLKKHYFNGVFRLDARYYLTQRIGISLTPTYSFGLSDAAGTKPVIARRNLLGLAVGLNFKF